MQRSGRRGEQCLLHHHEASQIRQPLRNTDLRFDQGCDAQLYPALDNAVDRRREVAPVADNLRDLVGEVPPGRLARKARTASSEALVAVATASMASFQA